MAKGGICRGKGRSYPGEILGRLPENNKVNRDANMMQLIGELDTKLEELEEMGAYVAAAHLQAAIESLRSHCKIEQTRSNPD